jgi:hypothetical protein
MLNSVQRSSSARVLDFTRLKLEHALRARRRYRYVQPHVLREGDALRVECSCCSRNIDAQGGVIDIALLCPCDAQAWLGTGCNTSTNEGAEPAHLPRPRSWCLYARDHADQSWRLWREDAPLDELLELLCLDVDRVFWP